VNDTRWKQRFQNYSNIASLLEKELKNREIDSFTDLERGGIGQWYELSFELLWKLIKDYLEFSEVEIGLISPKNILKTAAEVGLLEEMDVDGDILIKMHLTRNELTHVYDEEKFSDILKLIQSTYIHEIATVRNYFEKLIRDE